MRERLSLWLLSVACRMLPDPYFRTLGAIAKLMRDVERQGRKTRVSYGILSFVWRREPNGRVTETIETRIEKGMKKE